MPDLAGVQKQSPAALKQAIPQLTAFKQDLRKEEFVGRNTLAKRSARVGPSMTAVQLFLRAECYDAPTAA
jgi:hypothetical protein